ncbi:MAG: Zn-ribbon domain-containing OB-fold protein [Anaerolineaceae bacterium]|nr:Zn-ribbon domain-containing OB-fold protein [Anaerolineaceae bacterium]
MDTRNVTSLIERKTVLPKWAGANDPWAAFRQVEVITLELTQSYKHSLGKYSRFFIELENRRFFGTQCPTCHRVYTPPRPLCPNCLTITAWQELPGTGTVQTFSVMHFPALVNDDVRDMKTPIILAYVLPDGGSTLFPHVLKAPPDSVHIGMRVRVAYAESPVQHPIHLMYFVPLEE